MKISKRIFALVLIATMLIVSVSATSLAADSTPATYPDGQEVVTSVIETTPTVDIDGVIDGVIDGLEIPNMSSQVGDLVGQVSFFDSIYQWFVNIFNQFVEMLYGTRS